MVRPSIFPFLLLFLPIVVNGGDHKPLCQKVKEASLVFEIGFEVRGEYPKTYLEKEWEPPYRELLKTAQAGRITQVFKGDVKSGDPWQEKFGIIFRQSSRVQDWIDFFKRKKIRTIAFLKKVGDRYQSTSWAEATAGCSASPHFSWCSGYKELKEQIKKCLE